MNDRDDFRILSLDGGGSKGIYTLGVLRDVEALAKRPLHEEFDLIYGTSTGAIIAALLGIGCSTEEAARIYFSLIPDVMKHKLLWGRSAALRKNAVKIFGDKKFEEFKTNIGIVVTSFNLGKPMIFKTSREQVHGRANTFLPGFGCTIADALMASSAAYPFFKRQVVETTNLRRQEVLDGGFVGNNPTLFAIADAIQAFNIPKEKLKVLSVGVGIYDEPRRNPFKRFILNLWPLYFTRKMLETSSATIEQLRKILFPEVLTVRINEAFPGKAFSTDLLESDKEKLEKLNSLGSESFGNYELELKRVFGW